MLKSTPSHTSKQFNWRLKTRWIKPEIFKDEAFAECSIQARLLLFGLWCLANNDGWLPDRPRKIRMLILPYDNFDVDALLAELDAVGFIRRADGGIQCSDWRYWQGFQRTIPRLWHKLRLSVFERDNYTCQYCGKFTDKPQADHVMPISRGGSDTLDNLVTACPQCNMSKGDRTPDEWQAIKSGWGY